MTGKHNLPRNLLWLSLICLVSYSSLIWADEGRTSLGSGIDFSSGKYGGSTATDVTYIPITGKYETGDWLFKLTLPYIQITGPANVTPNIGITVYPSNAVRTDAGLGDVVAGTSYSVVNSAQRGIVIDVTGKIKFGTADKSKGLGTGANDYSAEASLYKILGQYNAFATLGYKVFGQSAGYTLNNVFYGSLGTAYKISDKTSTGLIYDYRNQTSVNSDPQKLWTAFVNRKISSSWKAQAYLFSGAGNSSPEIGGGVMVSKVF